MDDAPRRALAVYLLYAVISIAFCSPLFAHPLGVGTLDWDQHLFYYAQVIKNVVEYGQPPFWSPWYCGGNVMWQNPQVPLLSPAFPLSAATGLALAMKLNIVLHYWLGFVGMHLLLTRVLGLSFVPAVVYLASLFTLAGGQALHLAVGHSVFLPAFLLPWSLYFVIRAVQTRDVRPALYGAMILAWMTYAGGLHIVWMAIPTLAIFAFAYAVALRRWRPVVVAIAVGAAGAAYAAPKLVPAALFVGGDRFWDTREPILQADRMTPSMMLHAYIDPAQDRRSRFAARDQLHDWYEYGDYVGVLAALLFAASVVWFLLPGFAHDAATRTLAVPFVVTALVFLALSAGEFSRWAPAALLGRVPFFSSFRIPSRYTVVVSLFGALAAAALVRSLLDAVSWTTAARTALTLVAVVGTGQLLIVNRAHFRDAFASPPLERGFRVLGGTGNLVRDVFVNPYTSGAPMLHALMNDQAVLWCYESLQLKRGADDQRALVWTDGPAQISSVAFTPNRVTFSAVGGAASTRVYLNQNYAPGWSSTAGPVRLDPQAGGRMYVDLAPGQTGRYAFAFSPPGLWAGVLILLVAAAVSVAARHRAFP
jgi:hypothetical protein